MAKHNAPSNVIWKTIDLLVQYWKLTHSYALRSFLFWSGFEPFPLIIIINRDFYKDVYTILYRI